MYGDVYGNGDLCFIPNFTVNILTAVLPVVVLFSLSIIGIALLFLMTGTSNNEDLKYDDIYFTSKNNREVFKLLFLFIVIGLTWLFSAIHLIAVQLYLLIIAIIAQIALAAYIVVVYGVNVIYIFIVARKKSYYPQEDVTDMNTSIAPVLPMNVECITQWDPLAIWKIRSMLILAYLMPPLYLMAGTLPLRWRVAVVCTLRILRLRICCTH